MLNSVLFFISLSFKYVIREKLELSISLRLKKAIPEYGEDENKSKAK